jgi:hypothetical protein
MGFPFAPCFGSPLEKQIKHTVASRGLWGAQGPQ